MGASRLSVTQETFVKTQLPGNVSLSTTPTGMTAPTCPIRRTHKAAAPIADPMAASRRSASPPIAASILKQAIANSSVRMEVPFHVPRKPTNPSHKQVGRTAAPTEASPPSAMGAMCAKILTPSDVASFTPQVAPIAQPFLIRRTHKPAAPTVAPMAVSPPSASQGIAVSPQLPASVTKATGHP